MSNLKISIPPYSSALWQIDLRKSLLGSCNIIKCLSSIVWRQRIIIESITIMPLTLSSLWSDCPWLPEGTALLQLTSWAQLQCAYRRSIWQALQLHSQFCNFCLKILCAPYDSWLYERQSTFWCCKSKYNQACLPLLQPFSEEKYVFHCRATSSLQNGVKDLNSGKTESQQQAGTNRLVMILKPPIECSARISWLSHRLHLVHRRYHMHSMAWLGLCTSDTHHSQVLVTNQIVFWSHHLTTNPLWHLRSKSQSAR